MIVQQAVALGLSGFLLGGAGGDMLFGACLAGMLTIACVLDLT